MTTLKGLSKVATGVRGFDDITGGGLPFNRSSLICGGAGSGKTLFALTFILEGALNDEPGAFICFEETEEELASNVASLGYDLDGLIAKQKLAVDFMRIDRSEIEETGDFDLEGLFIRIDSAIRSVNAKRVALDTIEALFSGFSDLGLLRSELRRLFRWLKDRGVTAVVTAERGDGSLTRQGLEEYVSDCVILLDHRVVDQVATRRIRVVKYRGAAHGTNEYPFLIDRDGLSVLPVTSVDLAHEVSNEKIPTGVAGLDEMLGGAGYWRGSSILVSGMAGTGKTTLAAHFIDAACRRGERALFFAFEESPKQIVRNMASVGIELQRWIDGGLLRLSASRPTFYGLEMHLARMHKEVEEFRPSVVVVDPLYNLRAVGTALEVSAMLLRMIDHLKSQKITAMFTTLDHDSHHPADQARVSSLMDAWLQVRVLEGEGERNRSLYVLKARGLAHSNQIREFILSSDGVRLQEAYLGLSGVVAGSARLVQEAREREAEAEREMEVVLKQRETQRKRRQVEAEIAALQAELAEQEAETALFLGRRRAAIGEAERLRRQLAAIKGAE